MSRLFFVGPCPIHGPLVIGTFGYHAGTHRFCFSLGVPVHGGRAFVMAAWLCHVCGLLSVLPLAASRPNCRSLAPHSCCGLGPCLQVPAGLIRPSEILNCSARCSRQPGPTLPVHTGVYVDTVSLFVSCTLLTGLTHSTHALRKKDGRRGLEGLRI
jgi:hypothetical protein